MIILVNYPPIDPNKKVISLGDFIYMKLVQNAQWLLEKRKLNKNFDYKQAI